MDMESLLKFIDDHVKARGETITELCKNTNIARQNFYFWARGRKPSLSVLKRIADYLDVPLETLTDILENGIVQAYNPDENPTPPKGYVVIPEYRLTGSCGNGSEPEWEEVLESKPVVYDEAFFIRHNVKPKQCMRIRATGDSMEPFICNGDRITFAKFPDSHVPLVHIVDGSVYVISIDGAMRIKRIQRCKDGIIISSDNEDKYPPETYIREELDRVRIFGKVLEIVRSL